MIPLEVALGRPLAPYGAEQLRNRLLFSVVSNRDLIEGALVVAQMTQETEARVVLAKVITLSPSALGARVPSRRRFLDVDKDLRANQFLVEPALSDLLGLGAPGPYVDLVRRHLAGDYARYRVCATAVLLSLAAALS